MNVSKTSNAQKQAVIKYAKSHFKRIPLDVQLSSYDELKAEADAAGETVNGYIKKSIAMRMGRDFDSAKIDSES